jgi:hypothetical protein
MFESLAVEFPDRFQKRVDAVHEALDFNLEELAPNRCGRGFGHRGISQFFEGLNTFSQGKIHTKNNLKQWRTIF